MAWVLCLQKWWGPKTDSEIPSEHFLAHKLIWKNETKKINKISHQKDPRLPVILYHSLLLKTLCKKNSYGTMACFPKLHTHGFCHPCLLFNNFCEKGGFACIFSMVDFTARATQGW